MTCIGLSVDYQYRSNLTGTDGECWCSAVTWRITRLRKRHNRLRVHLLNVLWHKGESTVENMFAPSLDHTADDIAMLMQTPKVHINDKGR